MIIQATEQVAGGGDLSERQMAEVISCVMEGGCTEGEIVDLLAALHAKGETIEEIAGAARALRRHMTPISSNQPNLLDTCGTGGDCSGTFNISTAAALVTAAAGVPVAKHGNRGITSKSGSADVLAELGVDIRANLATVERCLEEVGIGFCFAPLAHPSMKHVAEARRRLGTPTIFNLLGPLCNPASAPYQLLGVGRSDLRPRLASALNLLGTKRAAVVWGEDGLDEVTIGGRTRVTIIQGGQMSEVVWSPEQFGVSQSPLDALRVDGPKASAAMIRAVLGGRPGAARDIVVVNAAAALWLVGAAASLHDAARAAQVAIDQGRARDLLERLVSVSHTT